MKKLTKGQKKMLRRVAREKYFEFGNRWEGYYALEKLKKKGLVLGIFYPTKKGREILENLR